MTGALGEHRLGEVVDIARVPATGDATTAVLQVPTAAASREIECEVLVVGGGMGGVAAALAALRRGRQACLVEETDWLGGQSTAQGVSALDEHDLIETLRRHRELREPAPGDPGPLRGARARSKRGRQAIPGRPG